VIPGGQSARLDAARFGFGDEIFGSDPDQSAGGRCRQHPIGVKRRGEIDRVRDPGQSISPDQHRRRISGEKSVDCRSELDVVMGHHRSEYPRAHNHNR
jgi:hypothetical protein